MHETTTTTEDFTELQQRKYTNQQRKIHETAAKDARNSSNFGLKTGDREKRLLREDLCKQKVRMEQIRKKCSDDCW
jgi:hypothetical protein